MATVKSLKADVSSVSASSQRLKLETPAFKIGGQIYVFNSADDAKLPCFVSLRWFPGSMGFQNGAGMKTEKPLGTKLPFKSTRGKSRTLSWWVMKLSFGMILFFQDRGRLVGVTIFYFLFTVTSKFGGKAIFLSFFKWRSKIFWKFPEIVKYGKTTLWKDKEYSTGPSEQGRGVYVSIRRLS